MEIAAVRKRICVSDECVLAHFFNNLRHRHRRRCVFYEKKTGELSTDGAIFRNCPAACWGLRGRESNESTACCGGDVLLGDTQAGGRLVKGVGINY